MIFVDSGLKGKSAIVTGGSRGIGREIVSALAAEGATVTYLYRREPGPAIDGVTAVQADVRNRERCEAVAKEVADRTGRIDLLVNNSGITRDNLLAGMSDEELRDVIDTNVLGTMVMTQAVLPTMMRQRSGSIILLSSVSGEKGGRGQANYAASKGAINAITKSLAVELAPRNIRVNAVAPGVIETEMSRPLRELAGDEVLSKILLKRYGKPAEIANAVCFLASRYAEYITGEILHVDGGFKMA